jgi:hypothetical protein
MWLAMVLSSLLLAISSLSQAQSKTPSTGEEPSHGRKVRSQ